MAGSVGYTLRELGELTVTCIDWCDLFHPKERKMRQESDVRRLLFFPVLFALTLQASPAHCQKLTFQAESGQQTVLARADVEALPHIKVTTSVSGSPATFEGILLRAALEKAGIGFGETLKGKRLASCLLVEAADGY